jgi:hypothetical protein
LYKEIKKYKKFKEIMKAELEMCVERLLVSGLNIEQIDMEVIEKDFNFWLDVDLTCVFYLDRYKMN